MWNDVSCASFFQSMLFDCSSEHSPIHENSGPSWTAELQSLQTHQEDSIRFVQRVLENRLCDISIHIICVNVKSARTPRPDLQRFDVHSLKQVLCALHDLQRELIGITLVIAGSQSVYVHVWLVVYPPLWKIWKSVGMIISNIWKNKTCSKPPTRYPLWFQLRDVDKLDICLQSLFQNVCHESKLSILPSGKSSVSWMKNHPAIVPWFTQPWSW
jgi:hypothetical protein